MYFCFDFFENLKYLNVLSSIAFHNWAPILAKKKFVNIAPLVLHQV